MQASACPPTPRFLARKSSQLRRVPQVVAARSHAEMTLPGGQDGEQAGSSQAICPSSATALREPELAGVLRPSATRCHHRGLYLSRNAMTDRLRAAWPMCLAIRAGPDLQQLLIQILCLTCGFAATRSMSRSRQSSTRNRCPAYAGSPVPERLADDRRGRLEIHCELGKLRP